MDATSRQLAGPLVSTHIASALASFGPRPLGRHCSPAQQLAHPSRADAPCVGTHYRASRTGRHCSPVGQLTSSRVLTCIALRIARSTRFTVCPFTCTTVHVHWRQSKRTRHWYPNHTLASTGSQTIRTRHWYPIHTLASTGPQAKCTRHWYPNHTLASTGFQTIRTCHWFRIIRTLPCLLVSNHTRITASTGIQLYAVCSGVH